MLLGAWRGWKKVEAEVEGVDELRIEVIFSYSA
jgi:hypothetical protein